MALIPFTRYFKPSIQIRLGVQTPEGAQVLAGVPDPTIVENVNGAGIRVRFRIKKSITSSANTAELDIFNMDGDRVSPTEAAVASAGKSPISIAVGYDNIVGRVFSGDIKRFDSRLVQPPDIITHIGADDSGDEIDEVKIVFSAPAASAEQLVAIALKAFTVYGNVPIQVGQATKAILKEFGPADTVFPIAHVGRAADLLDEAARILHARWWIEDGELHMTKLGRPRDGIAVELDTERLFSDLARDRNGFVRFKTFCDPNIVPGRQVLVDSGVYRVHMVEYSGDTFGGTPWSADVIAWDSALDE